MTLLLDPPRPVAPDIHDDATRRKFLAGAGAALLLAACGAEEATDTAAPTTTDGDSAFPVTIEHKYGSTDIPAEPKRVVTVGLSDQDPLLALGVKPVGVTDWYGDYPFATWPWAQDELGDAHPEVLSIADTSAIPNFEQVAALTPDLIIGQRSGMTERDYEILSQIAPTVAQSEEYPDFATPWQEMTLIIGRALGREARAQEMIADVEARFVEARERHPELVGASALYVSGEPGSYSIIAPTNARVNSLTGLGLEFPAEVAELFGDTSFVSISEEQLELLDHDLLVWGANPALRSHLETNELYQRLDVARQGRDVYLDTSEPLGGALTWGTVLSLPFLLDGLVPMLVAAVDGDPATPVPSSF